MQGFEDQITTIITSAITFVAGWLLDNQVPRKAAQWLISLVVKKK